MQNPDNMVSNQEVEENESCKVNKIKVTLDCEKLQLAENLAACLEGRELIRETEVLTCNSKFVEEVMSNYIIAKQVISSLSWQDKFICKLVCSTWYSAVNALKKEQVCPQDFVVTHTTFKQSGTFYTEPMVVLTFTNRSGYTLTCKCKHNCPCKPPCDQRHYSIDMLQNRVCAPKSCMLTIKSRCVSYMPLKNSITYENIIKNKKLVKWNPFIGGVYIPTIPNVTFHTIDLVVTFNIKTHFYDVVDKITQNHIIKGVIVYVTESYLLASDQSIAFLNYFKTAQPDVPFALGGCIVEDVMCTEDDIIQNINALNRDTDVFNTNLISIGIFTVPKSQENIDNNGQSNFEMFSLILESNEWATTKIQEAIKEFSAKIPKFEHSVVLKLSCEGRDSKHEVEQDSFRASFPNTRLVGCFGNGEIGINHPPRSPPKENFKLIKRRRVETEPQYGIMYAYSTVFVYMGWGRAN